jgi:hypothetical protein
MPGMAAKNPKKKIVDHLVYVDWGRPRTGDAAKVVAFDVSNGWNSRVLLKSKKVSESFNAPSHAEKLAADILLDDPGATVAIAIHGDPVIVSLVPAYVVRGGRRVQDGLRIAQQRGVAAVVPGWEG